MKATNKLTNIRLNVTKTKNSQLHSYKFSMETISINLFSACAFSINQKLFQVCISILFIRQQYVRYEKCAEWLTTKWWMGCLVSFKLQTFCTYLCLQVVAQAKQPKQLGSSIQFVKHFDASSFKLNVFTKMWRG